MTTAINLDSLSAEDKVKYLEEQLRLLKASPAPPVMPVPPPAEPLRLDFGCGKNKKEGFKGVDIRPFEGVDIVLDIAESHWPWPDESVDEAHASHFIEHLTWPQRVHFFNELGRVLKKGGKATLVWPHWCSDRHWGDPTHHQPMSPFGLLYLNQEWRKVNAPHDDYASNTEHTWHEYTCDFDHVISYSLAPWLAGRNQEFLQFAMYAYKEAAQDVIATLTKR
jgi:SAM-dependent methyltransferase